MRVNVGRGLRLLRAGDRSLQEWGSFAPQIRTRRTTTTMEETTADDHGEDD